MPPDFIIDLTPAAPLSDAIAAARDRLDATAERVRASYVTAGEIKQSIYREKAREAREILAEPLAANPADYPLVAARARATRGSLVSAATEISRQAARWVEAAATIEEAADDAKRACGEADTYAALGRAERDGEAALLELLHVGDPMIKSASDDSPAITNSPTG